MLKDSFYFSHDANARHDLKCVMLIMEHGYEGYGIFWAINELMRTENEVKLKIAQIGAISKELGIEEKKFRAVLKTCMSEEVGLYASDEKYFWSERLRANVEEYKERHEQAKVAADARWKDHRKKKETSIL